MAPSPPPNHPPHSPKRISSIRWDYSWESNWQRSFCWRWCNPSEISREREGKGRSFLRARSLKPRHCGCLGPGSRVISGRPILCWSVLSSIPGLHPTMLVAFAYATPELRQPTCLQTLPNKRIVGRRDRCLTQPI